MNKIHELKTWPLYFQEVWAGRKTHEIRVNDRNYQVGDYLFLREYDPTLKEYTGNECAVLVTYITEGGSWGLPENICVMSIRFSLRLNDV